MKFEARGLRFPCARKHLTRKIWRNLNMLQHGAVSPVTRHPKALAPGCGVSTFCDGCGSIAAWPLHCLFRCRLSPPTCAVSPCLLGHQTIFSFTQPASFRLVQAPCSAAFASLPNPVRSCRQNAALGMVFRGVMLLRVMEAPSRACNRKDVLHGSRVYGECCGSFANGAGSPVRTSIGSRVTLQPPLQILRPTPEI